MYWADKFVQTIIKSGKYKPYWVDDMKTPSGKIHVGSLRGVITHQVIYQVLKEAGKKVIFSYVIDDYDPMDALPVYLDKDYYQQFMGQPLSKIPSPKPGYKSYADYFAQDFIEVFNGCGCHPQIIWASELYQSGKMNEGIEKCLNNAAKIREIYYRISGSKKPADWYPFQVICEKCGKVGTTKVIDWDGKKVTYQCLPDLVKWAKGCGYQGKTSPFDGNGKLPWKIEWAVKWQVIGVTIEGAGKDHMSKGGSHDIATAICREVLNYPPPFSFSHEHFLIGGKKMSSSKGLGSSAREMYELLPPELLRFLILRPRYNQAIDFNPYGETIPNLFDEYDFCCDSYYHKKGSDFGRIWELCQIKTIPSQKPFLPRFRELAFLIQLPNIDVFKKFTQDKGKKLTQLEIKILKERIKYAKIWLAKYAPSRFIYKISQKIPEEVKKLSQQQKFYLSKIRKLLEKKKWKPEKLQQELYQQAKKLNLPSTKAFEAIYLVFTGKNYGPKAAWFLLNLNKNFVIKRFKEAER